MVKVLQPKTLLVYGSMPEKIFKKISDSGIIIKSYPSQTATAFGEKYGKQA